MSKHASGQSNRAIPLLIGVLDICSKTVKCYVCREGTFPFKIILHHFKSVKPYAKMPFNGLKQVMKYETDSANACSIYDAFQ